MYQCRKTENPKYVANGHFSLLYPGPSFGMLERPRMERPFHQEFFSYQNGQENIYHSSVW